MIKTFLKDYGDALLHCLGAVAIMLVGWWFGLMLLALAVNTLSWPGREIWQKMTHGDVPLKFGAAVKALFTSHVLLEWVPAVMVGAIIFIYGVLK